MPFFKSSRPASSPSSSSSSTRSVSPLGASRYEQPYAPSTPQRRTPPNRSANGPENFLFDSNYSSSRNPRMPPPRVPHTAAPTVQKNSSNLRNPFEPKTQALTSHRPQTSYIQGLGPKRPGHVHRTGMPLVVVNEEPDFSRAPVKMDELDSFGSHAKPVIPQRQEGAAPVKFNVGRSVMRNGPVRDVRVVDAGIVERLMPGYEGDGGRRDSDTLPGGVGR